MKEFALDIFISITSKHSDKNISRRSITFINQLTTRISAMYIIIVLLIKLFLKAWFPPMLEKTDQIHIYSDLLYTIRIRLDLLTCLFMNFK